MAVRPDDDATGRLGQAALAYADTLYNFARYLSGNSTDAEDLVQETYAKALRAADQFEPGTNLKAWLFRILRNTWISLARRRRGSPMVGGLDTVTPDVEAEPTWFCDDIELDRLRKLVADEIEPAMMALSEDARMVVLLDLEGLSETDTAAVLGCPVGTVKSRLARARSPAVATCGTTRHERAGDHGLSDRAPALLDDQRGRLDPATAAALPAHLEGCADCVRAEAAERLLTEQLERRCRSTPLRWP